MLSPESVRVSFVYIVIVCLFIVHLLSVCVFSLACTIPIAIDNNTEIDLTDIDMDRLNRVDWRMDKIKLLLRQIWNYQHTSPVLYIYANGNLCNWIALTLTFYGWNIISMLMAQASLLWIDSIAILIRWKLNSRRFLLWNILTSAVAMAFQEFEITFIINTAYC